MQFLVHKAFISLPVKADKNSFKILIIEFMQCFQFSFFYLTNLSLIYHGYLA